LQAGQSSTQLKGVRQRISEKSDQVRSASDEAAKVEASLQATQQELAAEVTLAAQLLAQAEQLILENADAEEQTSQQAQEIADLEAQLTRAQEDLESSLSEGKSLEEQIAKLQEQIESANAEAAKELSATEELAARERHLAGVQSQMVAMQ